MHYIKNTSEKQITQNNLIIKNNILNNNITKKVQFYLECTM